MKVQNITVEAAQILLNKQQAVLVDVREADEYHTMHIPGAQHIPLNGLTLDSIYNPTKKIIIHCHSGHRSHIACSQILQDNPDMDVCNLAGGITAWKAAGYEVQS